MAAEELNLQGLWNGIFTYPRSLPPNQFDAELRDHGGVLTGETFEHGNNGRSKGQPLHAMIEGQRHGFDVSFVKRYDEFRRATTPVFYSGSVSADGSEISGTWDIPGQWSGTFLMIRAKPNAAAVEQKAAEVVR
jgi:hypothetical protein